MLMKKAAVSLAIFIIIVVFATIVSIRMDHDRRETLPAPSPTRSYSVLTTQDVNDGQAAPHFQPREYVRIIKYQ